MGTGIDNTRVEGQLPHVAPVHVHNKDLFVSRAVTLEGNLTGVGRPDGTIVIEAVIGGELRNAAPICVHDIDILAGAAAVDHAPGNPSLRIVRSPLPSALITTMSQMP